MGWNGKSNGVLLALAAQNGFDALLIADRGYEHQHNPGALPCAVVLILAHTNKIEDIRPLVTPLLAALAALHPRSVVKVF